MPSLNDIRSTFLGYFEKQGHEVVPSSPLVPRNDPTLMFANSGMVQFKNLFTGLEHRDYTRATTSQKCVRAGGKHNDLDNVGYTARHHTFFEMLGNFSFGDYFKPEAIPFAYELITREFGIDPTRLLATVYHTDDDAAAIWKKVGIPEDRIIRIATSDNFWQMGSTAPAGPAPRSSTIMAITSGAARRDRPKRMATGSSRSGTSSSCRTSSSRMARCASSTCSRSTPAWGWSGSARSCRANTTITTPT